MQIRQQIEIEKILRNAGLHRGMWARDAQMAVRADSDESDGIEWILTSEKPTTIFDWNRWEFVEEILLADGMMVPASGQVPLLDSHNRMRCGDVLGHVRDFSEGMAGEYPARTGRAFFAADTYSQETKDKVLDRHITDGSVGYEQSGTVWIEPETEVKVKGRMFAGGERGLRVTYEWLLKEFSPTPIGADVLAKVRMLCGA